MWYENSSSLSLNKILSNMIGRALKLTREFHRLTQWSWRSALHFKLFRFGGRIGNKQPTLELLIKYSEEFSIPASTFLVFVEEQTRPPTEKQKARAKKVLRF